MLAPTSVLPVNLPGWDSPRLESEKDDRFYESIFPALLPANILAERAAHAASSKVNHAVATSHLAGMPERFAKEALGRITAKPSIALKARDFKAGLILRQLEQVPNTDAPDEVRIVIPKACIFIYEVVNNRGGRHDAGDVDANAMDATTILPLMSWIVAEMVRFCSMNGDADAAMSHISALVEKQYPVF